MTERETTRTTRTPRPRAPGGDADGAPDAGGPACAPTSRTPAAADGAGRSGPAASDVRRAWLVDREAGDAREIEDEVAGEYPLTLLVNGREMATLVCTPTHMEEMALGFLTAEGVLRRGEPLRRFFLDREEGVVEVEAPEREGALEQEMFGKRYVGSCCGKSRTGFYMANDARTARRVEADLSLPAEACFGLMDALQDGSSLFGRTGGVHNAGLATADGLEVVRTDIGRHNTLDKLYGHALREDVDLTEKVVVFSGRISSEILLKISKMGCPVLLSKCAPTALALEMAEELGVTAVGFLKPERMTVYTHPGRITGVATAG